MALTSLVAQACSDPTVRTETETSNEDSSTSSQTVSGDGSAETMGATVPQWAIGVFSTEADRVGMSFSDNIHWWSNVEIAATGSLAYDLYVCSGHKEHQEFRWTLAEDGLSLNVQPVPPTEVFIYGNGNTVSELIVEPGESCDALTIRSFHVEEMIWVESEYHRGDVCARATGPDGCTFTFELCDGTPPPPCE